MSIPVDCSMCTTRQANRIFPPLYSSLHFSKSLSLFSVTGCLVPFLSQKRPLPGMYCVDSLSYPLSDVIISESVDCCGMPWSTFECADTFMSADTSLTNISKLDFVRSRMRGDLRGVTGSCAERKDVRGWIDRVYESISYPSYL